jgi:methyl coenzyme M reductase system subunit A2
MLRVENLAKDYNVLDERKRVLEGISFTVNDGEILGITGKSGSGKSTLLRILRGVESFDEGVIELEGKQFFPDSDKDDMMDLIQNTAIHLQRNFGLWNGPAIENIIRKINSRNEGHEGLPESDSPYYDEMYEESMEYLKLVGLEHKALHATSALSGGEKQRLILARQIVAKPKLLLLLMRLVIPAECMKLLQSAKSMACRSSRMPLAPSAAANRAYAWGISRI